jgi:hypothetical protein
MALVRKTAVQTGPRLNVSISMVLPLNLLTLYMNPRMGYVLVALTPYLRVFALTIVTILARCEDYYALHAIQASVF